MGARKFLIAYNINLATPDVDIAKRIAKAIRFSSGGFRYVKAMGVPLASRNLAQVSMNLTDFEQTPVHRVFEAVRNEAARYGVAVAGSEIVGLVPKKALEMTAEWYLRAENFRPDLVLENRLAASQPGGLNEFLDELAAPTAVPGGGSAAAAAGALAAALGVMVVAWRSAAGIRARAALLRRGRGARRRGLPRRDSGLQEARGHRAGPPRRRARATRSGRAGGRH